MIDLHTGSKCYILQHAVLMLQNSPEGGEEQSEQKFPRSRVTPSVLMVSQRAFHVSSMFTFLFNLISQHATSTP